jgi:hypothetical protein
MLCRRAALDLDRGAHGVDRAHEFRQQPIAHGLDDAAAELLDGGHDHGLVERVEPGERRLLVAAHEARIAGDVGR